MSKITVNTVTIDQEEKFCNIIDMRRQGLLARSRYYYRKLTDRQKELFPLWVKKHFEEEFICPENSFIMQMLKL